MTEQSLKDSERELEEFGERFRRRYIFKKKANAILCFFIALCGTTAVLYSRFIFRNPLFDRLRYMTFWGTIFTSAVSLIFGIVCIAEAHKETETTARWAYFLRLSSVTTELVIFFVVLFGLTPLVPDQPDITSYPGIMMHLVLPTTTVMSFLLNDSPIGKPKPAEPLIGTSFIAIYTVVMIILFGTGTISSERAPYSFLDFENTTIFFKMKMVPSGSGELLLPYIPMNHLPLHFCSMQIIFIAAAKFMKNDKYREALLAYMSPTCFLGGLFALAIPSIFTTTISIKQAFTSPISYQFFIFHSMLVALGLIIARSGEIEWSMKHFRNTTLTVYLLGFISIYLNSMLASPTYEDGRLVSVDFWTNFFFTYQNPLGIKLTEVWQWYLYLLVLMLLTVILLYLFHLPLVRGKEEK